MVIREPDNMELKKILSLSSQSIFEGTLREVKPAQEKIEELVFPLLEAGSYYLVAVEDGDIMGWILLGESRDAFSDKTNGFIYELFVLDEFRGKGISKRLMSSALNELKQSGYEEVRLSAYVGNQAIKLYEKMGFIKKIVTMKLEL